MSFVVKLLSSQDAMNGLDEAGSLDNALVVTDCLNIPAARSACPQKLSSACSAIGFVTVAQLPQLLLLADL